MSSTEDSELKRTEPEELPCHVLGPAQSTQFGSDGDDAFFSKLNMNFGGIGVSTPVGHDFGNEGDEELLGAVHMDIDQSPPIPTRTNTAFEKEWDDAFLEELDVEIDSLDMSKPAPPNGLEDDDDDALLAAMDVEGVSIKDSAQPSTSTSTTPSAGRRSEDESQLPPGFVKRRFPGPAGVLPELTLAQFSLLDKSSRLSKRVEKILAVKSSSLQKPRPESSLENTLLLQGRCWQAMMKRLDALDAGRKSPQKAMDIAWIRRKAKLRPSVFKIKIPFLVAVLQGSPEKFNKRSARPPCVKLVDPTGSILAAMDPAFIAEYTAELEAGAGVALQNFGIVRSGRELLLNVTAKNVILMTYKTDPVEGTKDEVNFAVETTTLSEYHPDKIMANYYGMDASMARAEIVAEGEEEQTDREWSSANLFSSAVHHPSAGSSSLLDVSPPPSPIVPPEPLPQASSVEQPHPHPQTQSDPQDYPPVPLQDASFQFDQDHFNDEEEFFNFLRDELIP